eukprot:COSAG01_NODE_4609_length_4882_cov_2.470834_1_plen_163_part_00
MTKKSKRKEEMALEVIRARHLRAQAHWAKGGKVRRHSLGGVLSVADARHNSSFQFVFSAVTRQLRRTSISHSRRTRCSRRWWTWAFTASMPISRPTAPSRMWAGGAQVSLMMMATRESLTLQRRTSGRDSLLDHTLHQRTPRIIIMLGLSIALAATILPTFN